MTLSHHPSEALLLDYAAGTATEAVELAVASHLSFCPHCRETGRLLEAVGGHLVSAVSEPTLRADSFDKVIARVGQGPAAASPSPPRRAIFPGPLRQAVGCDVDGVPWKRLGMGASHYVIPLNDNSATARLLKIPAGRPVPVHTHQGEELTLVLCGAFSDATGRFQRGDLQEADGSLEHQPHAAPGEDCICLAVTQAPLRFRGWAARLVQPFLGI